MRVEFPREEIRCRLQNFVRFFEILDALLFRRSSVDGLAGIDAPRAGPVSQLFGTDTEFQVDHQTCGVDGSTFAEVVQNHPDGSLTLLWRATIGHDLHPSQEEAASNPSRFSDIIYSIKMHQLLSTAT
ncbi:MULTISPECIES: hypothetical protein [unclassified Rhodococcus (in: high G+C Gram-positive bacteria)]|uniref:hypothetical protein n=1 Tax=unclassified Rhodococcus (in: high G+C Gram-positive bacteria) TaxID=192944 RepID=UPI0011426188|nr:MULTISPECIES: hypothetical protein [unclassified Rhodococcus (in: high G+C Gram-positive bacteria)]TQC35964.1 hypothetical protein EEB16_20595 [Rhodococcus sp. WS7]